MPSADPIPGLRYLAGYLAPEVHSNLLTAVDDHPWLTTPDHRVQVYGFRYSPRTQAAFPIGPLPDWGGELAAQLCSDGHFPCAPNQLVANDYPVGAGIFPHTDQDVFGDTVASVSLGSTCLVRFSHLPSGRVGEHLLEPGSLLLLTGEARWRWRHEIPAQALDVWQGRELPRSRRVSLTFRLVPTAQP